MKRLLIPFGFLFTLLLSGCSAVRLESSEKNPDIVLFQANKVLIVGMSRDPGARTAFESRLQRAFNAEGIEAVRSLDVFDVRFTESERSEAELDEVEQRLIDLDFDAILITRVIGSETRTTLREKIQEIDASYDRFSEDYLLHQGVYYDRNYYELATEYYTETALYCICQGKERNLIWKASMLVSDPSNVDQVVKEYTGLLLEEMERLQLIFGTDSLK